MYKNVGKEIKRWASILRRVENRHQSQMRWNPIQKVL